MEVNLAFKVLQVKYIILRVEEFCKTQFVNTERTMRSMGRDSAVGIDTRYGLEGPGIESRWGARFFSVVQTVPVAHPACYIMGTEYFPEVKRPGRGVDHSPQY
jgi:hypothetical protein